jgi:hypothetical protein
LIGSLPCSPEEFRVPEEDASSDFKNAILQLRESDFVEIPQPLPEQLRDFIRSQLLRMRLDEFCGVGDMLDFIAQETL